MQSRPNKPAVRVRRGPQRAAAGAAPVLQSAFRAKGFTRPEIISNWAAIVGQALARQTMPERLRQPRGSKDGAVLEVRVDGALGIELQHLEPLIVERINTFYGYRAVARLRLLQAPLPLPRAAGTKRARALSKDEEQALSAYLDTVGDERLKSALAALGRGVLGYIG